MGYTTAADGSDADAWCWTVSVTHKDRGQIAVGLLFVVMLLSSDQALHVLLSLPILINARPVLIVLSVRYEH